MSTKYKLNQHVFMMQGNAPQMRKVTAVTQIEPGNYYVLNQSGESLEHAKLLGYNLALSNEKLKWVHEENLFETIQLLQENLFGRCNYE